VKRLYLLTYYFDYAILHLNRVLVWKWYNVQYRPMYFCLPAVNGDVRSLVTIYHFISMNVPVICVVVLQCCVDKNTNPRSRKTKSLQSALCSLHAAYQWLTVTRKLDCEVWIKTIGSWGLYKIWHLAGLYCPPLQSSEDHMIVRLLESFWHDTGLWQTDRHTDRQNLS